jgi:transcriptional regulator with XRE-family HTH domain
MLYRHSKPPRAKKVVIHKNYNYLILRCLLRLTSGLLDKMSAKADNGVMNSATLKSLVLARGLSQADLARVVGVSRQTVSHWFSKAREVNLYSSHLKKIANGLGVSVETLSRPLPVLAVAGEREKWEADLLWDKLYPNLESFLAGCVRGQPPALARLVQVCGLYQSHKIAGKQVWRKFPDFKRFIHPAYRQALEVVWKTARDLEHH